MGRVWVCVCVCVGCVGGVWGCVCVCVCVISQVLSFVNKSAESSGITVTQR